MIRYNTAVKREQFSRLFYAISIYQGASIRAKQLLNTSRTFVFNCSYVYHMHPLITSQAEMGMHSPVHSIQSSTGKGFAGWT